MELLVNQSNANNSNSSNIATTITTTTTNNSNKNTNLMVKNKYLFREKCFLCHIDNPNPSVISDDDDDDDSENKSNKKIASSNSLDINRVFGFDLTKKLSKIPLWMCKQCKIKCDEEEKQNILLKVSLKFAMLRHKKPNLNKIIKK
jgi:hypothetical protein